MNRVIRTRNILPSRTAVCFRRGKISISGCDYQPQPIIITSPSATGTVTLDASVTGKELITPVAGSNPTPTIAFINQPSSGYVGYVRIQIITPATGTVTMVWPTSNVYWTGGTSAQLTALTVSRHYEYVCELENINIYYSNISEALY